MRKITVVKLLCGAAAIVGLALIVGHPRHHHQATFAQRFAPISEALAQVPSLPPPPFNQDIGALITNSARAAGTFNSAQQANQAYLGVVCTLNATANGGAPSTTFIIQGFDAASNSYYALATSSAMTATATPTSVVVYPGAVATAAPANMTIAGLHLPAKWRVSQVVGGTSTPTITGTLGCNYLR